MSKKCNPELSFLERGNYLSLVGLVENSVTRASDRSREIRRSIRKYRRVASERVRKKQYGANVYKKERGRENE